MATNKKYEGSSPKNIDQYGEEIYKLSLQLKRAIKNVRWCRQNCRTTSKMIVELNGSFKDR